MAVCSATARRDSLRRRKSIQPPPSRTAAARKRHISSVSAGASRVPSSAPMKPELHITTRPTDVIAVMGMKGLPGQVGIPVCLARSSTRLNRSVYPSSHTSGGITPMETLTPAARRVLDAAAELFYGQGINAVGVDLIARHAGVTKKTLYERFGSKEALVAAYLRERDERWRAWLTAEVDQFPRQDPAARVLATFD